MCPQKGIICEACEHDLDAHFGLEECLAKGCTCRKLRNTLVERNMRHERPEPMSDVEELIRAETYRPGLKRRGQCS